jgi:hypothetical protein
MGEAGRASYACFPCLHVPSSTSVYITSTAWFCNVNESSNVPVHGYHQLEMLRTASRTALLIKQKEQVCHFPYAMLLHKRVAAFACGPALDV